MSIPAAGRAHRQHGLRRPLRRPLGIRAAALHELRCRGRPSNPLGFDRVVTQGDKVISVDGEKSYSALSRGNPKNL